MTKAFPQSCSYHSFRNILEDGGDYEADMAVVPVAHLLSGVFHTPF